jgi:hypothetical protein
MLSTFWTTDIKRCGNTGLITILPVCHDPLNWNSCPLVRHSRNMMNIICTCLTATLEHYQITQKRSVSRCKIRVCIQKFPDWVDNEINNNKHSLRSNTKGYGAKLARLTYKTATQLYLGAESCTIYSSRSSSQSGNFWIQSPTGWTTGFRFPTEARKRILLVTASILALGPTQLLIQLVLG